MGFALALVTEDRTHTQRDGSQKPTEQPHAHSLVDAEHESTSSDRCSLHDSPFVDDSKHRRHQAEGVGSRLRVMSIMTSGRYATPREGGGDVFTTAGDSFSPARGAHPMVASVIDDRSRVATVTEELCCDSFGRGETVSGRRTP